MKKIKNFFNWLAWFEHKDSNQGAIALYGSIIALFILIFIPSWRISGNVPESAAVALWSSAGLGILLFFVASCLFSNPQKNWMIAVYEAKKIIADYPEYITEDDFCGSIYVQKVSSFETRLKGMREKDPKELSNFVDVCKKFFDGRKGLKVAVDHQLKFIEQIHEAREKIKKLEASQY